MTDFEAVRRLAPMAGLTDEEIAWAKEASDFSEGEASDLESRKPTHSFPQLSDDEVRALISNESRVAIIGFEVTSEAYYKKKYEAPILPGVRSGITVGIGYDLGYNTPEAVRRDFADLIPQEDIEELTKVCGLKGPKARPYLAGVSHIRVPIEAAKEVFRRATLPRFGRSVLATFPNAVDLHGHCFGMLLSLVYNRGSDLIGQQGDGGRRREMKAIHDLMAERRWSDVPEQFRLMKRIWKDDPKAKGVVLRRESEAKLFERGLDILSSTTVASVASSEFESARASDPTLERGDGNYDPEDEGDLEILERARHFPDKVIWPADDRSPDYSHIPDRTLSGSVFHIGPAEFELLFEVNGFKPTRASGKIAFGLRGAQLVASKENPTAEPRQENREYLTVRDCRPDHRAFRCIIGVYDVERGRVYGYPSSTVPNANTVAKHVAKISSSNMMLTGCYGFTVGWHLRGATQKERTIPGCLIENDRYKAVLRTADDHTLDIVDQIDNRAPFGDNLHPGLSDGPFPFSSAGCQVISGTVEPRKGGDRTKVRHVGEWARFRKALGLPDTGTGGHGTTIDYVLLTGLDAAIAHSVIGSGLDPFSAPIKRQIHRLRQGSWGPRVSRLNAALGLGERDVFDHVTAKRLGDLQRNNTGAVWGLYSPDMDADLSLDIFKDRVEVAGLERSGQGTPDKRLEYDQLALELGAEFEAHRGRRQLSSDEYQEGLLATVSELGTKALVSTGNVLLREAELTLKRYVCEGDAVDDLVDRDAIRQRVDKASQTSVTALKHALVWALRQATFSFAPTDLLERVVDYILNEVILPGSGEAGAAVVGRIDGGVALLCSRWSDSLRKRYPGMTEQPAPNTTMEETSEELPATAGPQAQSLTSNLSPIPEVDSESERLLGLIEAAASGTRPDASGVRSNIHSLRDYLRKARKTLTPNQHQRFLDILCDTRFMEHIAGSAPRDPYALMNDIEDALGQAEIDKAKVESRVRELCDVLADARLPLQAERIEQTIKALRKRRMPEMISILSDRVLTRNPNAELLGRIGPHYALSLIDSQRIVAAVDVLQTTLENGQLSGASAAEVWGGLGRAHKQIYVNHVRSESDAVALRSTMGPQLAKAIDAYSHLYDPACPDVNYWHGINLVALLKRAIGDRLDTGSRHDPEALARSIISVLEPSARGTQDHYLSATLGEAYLALGDISQASRFYAEFAGHPSTDAFALNSAVRQLQEVWRLEAATQGAGTLLIGLKAALAQKEGGSITLSANERMTIANATFAANQDEFESRTKGGKFVPFEYLKRVVMTGMAVAAIKQKPSSGGKPAPGSGATIGTGFLLDGSVFGLPPGRSYLLTNAHVLWDPERGQGAENNALTPKQAEIVFEGSGGETGSFEVGEVLWQSPSSLHDACLIALNRPAATIAPLAIAGAETKIQPDDGSGKTGTSLAVVGHPEGGALSVGFSGSLEEINARLVDKGPKGNSESPVYLHYSVPTEPGNSGSPVLETSGWRVVGLHHAGFNEVHGRPRLGQKAGTHHANEGICIQCIGGTLRSQLQNSPKPKRRGIFK